ncbi:MAG: hypothetical protein ACLGH0_12885 [Thermoanaerobaculia bacterium]
MNMAHVSNEQLNVFDEQLRACTQKQPDGRVAIDTAAVRRLVRRMPEVARRFVELHCIAAASNPKMLQAAVLVASAYHVELDDSAPLEQVYETAREVGGEEILERMGAGRPVALQDRPERKAALQWWRSHQKQEAHCDNCNRRMQRGEGFLTSGRVIRMGDYRMPLGDELLCEECFRKRA